MYEVNSEFARIYLGNKPTEGRSRSKRQIGKLEKRFSSAIHHGEKALKLAEPNSPIEEEITEGLNRLKLLYFPIKPNSIADTNQSI